MIWTIHVIVRDRETKFKNINGQYISGGRGGPKHFPICNIVKLNNSYILCKLVDPNGANKLWIQCGISILWNGSSITDFTIPYYLRHLQVEVKPGI